MYKFTDMTVKHKLDLFDKLVLPVLSYGSDVWGFNHGCAHLQHCKKYIKTVYHVLRNAMLDKTTCTNWCSLLKHVLQSLGF